jgi:hypothetical protein
MVKTYIHANDHELISSKPLSLPSMTDSKFKNNSPNRKNNYSTSGSSLKRKNSYFTKLSSLKSHSILFSSVSPHHESKQHLNSNNVFSPLSLLSTSFSHPSTVDSPGSDCDFEDLLLYFAYGSSFPPPSPTSSNSTIDSLTALEKFAVS